jgi:Flp pilus assembly protein TadD
MGAFTFSIAERYNQGTPRLTDMSPYLCCAVLIGFVLQAAATEQTLTLAIQDKIAAGNLAGARTDLTQALKEHPAAGGLWNLLGIVEAQQGNSEAAQSDFEHALRLSPQIVGVRLNLARVYQMRSEQEPALAAKAIAQYQAGLKLDPDQTEARFQLAVLLEWRGSFEDSLDELARLPEPERKRARALALECAGHAGLAHYEQAARAAGLLAAAPDLQEMDLFGALPALEKTGRDTIEIQLIEAARERKIAGPELLKHLAQAYERSQKFQEARATLESVAQKEALTVNLLMDLTRVAYKAGDREGALGYLAHARDLEPRDARPHFLFGLISLKLEVYVDARKSLEQAVALEPSNPDYNYALGLVALEGHDVSEAIPYFRKFTELRPDDPRGRLGAGIALYYGGQYPEARTEFAAITKYPRVTAPAHYFLGRIAMGDTDDDTAERELRLAVAASPDYVEAHAELGLIHIRRSEFDAASEELKKALAKDADNFLANTNLLMLYQRTKDPKAAAQSERLHELEKRREERKELLYRTIEVRPY